MRGLLLRWLILTAAILVAAHLFNGIEVRGLAAAFWAAALLGVLNALLRPILILITLPINILTLGLFTFVVNAILLWLVSGLFGGLVVDGFAAALIGSLVISLVSWLLTALIGERGRVDVISLRRSGEDRWE